MELSHHSGQPVGPQHLGGAHLDDAAGAYVDGVERGLVGPGVGQPRHPVLLVAERLEDLFDAAAVLGGHVE